MNIIRFNETINGRPYVIETLSVGQDRWRAHLARTAGGTTALMPFYGATPDEAAQHLTRWLARAATLSKPDPVGAPARASNRKRSPDGSDI